MDQETAKYLWALKEINKSLVVAIETALALMEKWESFDPDRRKAIIEMLKQLTARSKEAFEGGPGEPPAEH
jgi:hypothetical protein